MVAQILYISTPEFGIPSLQLLARDPRFRVVGVVTQPDKPAGRGLRLTPPPVKTAALELGLPLFQPSSLCDPDVQAAISALAPDVAAVAAYGQWIPAEIFDLPPKRSLNLHPSLLPRHRGAAPVPGALLAGDDQVGLSVLFVEEEMDAGDLLGQVAVPVGKEDTAGSLMARLAHLGAPFFVETLAAWVAGEIEPQPQDHSQATWIGRMPKGAGLVDWTRPAFEIARACRAFAPWPGTFTFFEGKRLLIHRATPLDASGPPGTAPGAVLRHGAGLAVVTGDGLLQLDRIQLEGRRILDAMELARGQRQLVGAVLHGQEPSP
jgi:methionyl-tRNA formyltransferase